VPPNPPTHRRQRERAGASIEGDHHNPSRTARKSLPPPSLPASAGPFPQSHHPTAHLIRKTAINPTRPGPTNPETSSQKTSAPAATQPAHTPAAAGTGRSEPWRRTLQPLAHSAKADPSQSLLSERNPPKPGRSGVRPERALEANTPTPRAAARKLILPRASSASATHQNPGGAVSGRSEPWRRTSKPHRAQRESSSFPEPPQRAQA